MRLLMNAVMTLGPVGWSSVAGAATVELTFAGLGSAGGGPIVLGEAIPQRYGDRRGVVDVRYGAVASLGSSVRRLEDALKYWDTGYGDLVDVAFCCGLGLTGAAEIQLVPLNGRLLTLHGMDFGDYRNRNNGARMLIFEGDDLSAPLFDSGDFDPGLGRLGFADLDLTSTTGLRIQWATAYNVGIDNVRFTVTPLPAGALLLAAALASLAVTGRNAAAWRPRR